MKENSELFTDIVFYQSTPSATFMSSASRYILLLNIFFKKNQQMVNWEKSLEFWLGRYWKKQNKKETKKKQKNRH